MDTTVELNSSLTDNEYLEMPERVHNIGLMQQRQNLLILSSVLFIGGILLVSLSKDDSKPTYNLRYKDTWEQAKMAEFRGNNEEAIKLYYDTLYYVENDFDESTMDGPTYLRRNNKIKEIRAKIEELFTSRRNNQ
jgi:hypothetical protein